MQKSIELIDQLVDHIEGLEDENAHLVGIVMDSKDIHERKDELMEDAMKQIQMGLDKIEELEERNKRQESMILALEEGEDPFLTVDSVEPRFIERQKILAKHITLTYSYGHGDSKGVENNYNIMYDGDVLGRVTLVKTNKSEFPFIKIFVEEEYRGQGVGEMAVWLAMGINEEYPGYCATIDVDNIASQKLFTGLGFELVSVEEQMSLRKLGKIKSREERYVKFVD